MSESAYFPLVFIPLLPLIGAAVNLLVGRKLSRETVHLIACAAIGASCILSILAVFGPLWDLWSRWREAGGHGAPPVIRQVVYTWIQSGDLKIDLAFALDPLSTVMILTVTFVGFLIHLYSTGYMSHDPRPAAYFGYLNLFSGAMLILVLGDSLPVMFIGWEGVGLCSYLLIGFWFDKVKNANAGRKAFVVNRIGDFGFLLGIFLLYFITKRVDFQGLKDSVDLLAQPLFGDMVLPVAFFAGVLLFVGAAGKSAQIPLYVWLPDAMAGPTPVSALIHAATMVTAGVYMVARLNFMYVLSPHAMMVVSGVGAATALFAAIIGFAQTDIKKVLAYSTVSQLGFMFVGVGTGAFVAGIFHLFTHAFFKAGLFLGAGSVMHAMGDRTEIMEMGGLRKKLPFTHATFFIYCLAIAGIFPFAGFFSKDEVLLGAWVAHADGWPAWYGKLLWGVLSLAALGTAYYMWRLYFLVFGGECRADEETKHHIHESPSVMTGPLVILAIGAMVLGFLGLPHLKGIHLTSVFTEWLAPVIPMAKHDVSDGTVFGLMGVALVLGITGIGIAAALFRNGPSAKARELAASLAPVRKLVANKFYVDELYDFIVVRPFKWACMAAFRVVDRVVIDILVVGGSALVVDVSGRVVRWWQNGDVQRYLAAIVVGTAAIFYFTTWSSPPVFVSTRGAGNTLKFTARVGSGPSAQASEISWDFNGDGAVDGTGREASWTFEQPGRHNVVMIVKDQILRRTRRVEREVIVQGDAGASSSASSVPVAPLGQAAQLAGGIAGAPGAGGSR
ncbi:MAG: NADH-quinone oxidoreductase subunit L [Deltaproteobacteria bacterium]|nr:NADH-quinone oxidoreductase subunit L [Deltaproteobacteria bacterium]